jgi:hypothetical protein
MYISYKRMVGSYTNVHLSSFGAQFRAGLEAAGARSDSDTESRHRLNIREKPSTRKSRSEKNQWVYSQTNCCTEN